MKLDCSFIVPVNNNKQYSKLVKSLKEFDDYQLIPIKGAKSFFDAWRKGLKGVKKKYVCFTHQDTEYVAIPKLSKYLKDDVGMIGVAGTEVLHKDQPWWFSQERLHGNILKGQIFHKGKEGNELSVFGAFGEVVVLDGVSMFTKYDIIKDIKLPKGYTWDYYDHVVSLEMIKKGYKLKTVPIVVVHASKGGDKRESFFKGQERFVKEYLDKTWRI